MLRFISTYLWTVCKKCFCLESTLWKIKLSVLVALIVIKLTAFATPCVLVLIFFSHFLEPNFFLRGKGIYAKEALDTCL